MATIVWDLKFHVSLMILTFLVGLTGAVSSRFGWPVYVAVPVVTALGMWVLNRSGQLPVGRTAGAILAVVVIALGIALYVVA